MFHTMTILGLTETLVLTEHLVVLGNRHNLDRISQEHRHRAQSLSPSWSSSSMFLPSLNTKFVVREWTVSFGKSLLLAWNLIWNLRIKCKHVHLWSWRLPGITFLLLCILCSHLHECKIIMTMSNQLTDSKKWETEWDISDIRTTSGTRLQQKNAK